ncbi:hypothetical protein BH11PLA2_BH11PLA2_48520 [soil metagenome]
MPQSSIGRIVRTAAVSLLLGIVAVPLAWKLWAADPPPVSGEPNVGGLPLFTHWPQNHKPEAVLVLTNQTFGYLSPCGCSRPQKGGLERRYNFMQSLRAKGWPVIGLDGGDVSPPKKIAVQDLLKYETAMKSLQAMGTVAVGLGDYDFDQRLDELLAKYALQNPNQPPVILAANLVGKVNAGILPRAQRFPGAGKRAMVEDIEIVTKDPISGTPMLPVGVTAVIGRNVFENKIAKIDPNFDAEDNGKVLKASLAAMDADAAKPAVKALLYTGSLEDAKKVAEAFPEFNVILCQIEESEPPQFPTVVNNGKTFIIQVGHKGQNVGVVGVFRENNELKLYYQLVPLGEDYLTKKGQVTTHPIINLMEKYTETVATQDLLAKYVEKPVQHPAMIQNPAAKLVFTGSEKCKTCHPQEFAVWDKTPHGHAMEALEKVAVQPKNRQFDGDCVVCHTVGFGMVSGYTNEKDTKHLRHVGCETCHGPGSGHNADPKNKELLKLLSPWKSEDGDRLPEKAVLEAMAKLKPGEPNPAVIPANKQRVMAVVGTMCLRCHDGENDPKFDLNVYMPKIWHSGLKAGGGLPGNGLPGNAK